MLSIYTDVGCSSLTPPTGLHLCVQCWQGKVLLPQLMRREGPSEKSI